MILEGRDINDIATQLRQRYPDNTHERFLRRERDYEAEQRIAAAMRALTEIVAKAVLDDLLRESKVESGAPDAERGGPA